MTIQREFDYDMPEHAIVDKDIVKGVVTDMGGAMSHAVIVGREYALPVVAGTLEGTRTITTGMRIRVDGDMGTVYILEK